MLKNIYKNYSNILKIIFALFLVCLFFTICHIFVKNIIITNNNFINNHFTVDKMINDDDYDSLNYKTIKDNITKTIKSIENAKEINYRGKSNSLIFYQEACRIMNMKLFDIKKVVINKLDDENSINQFKYNIDKFVNDLNADEENIKNVYESSIDASIEFYKIKYNKLINKCNTLIDEYKEVFNK